MNMNEKNGNRRDLSAAASGTVSLGGELTVNRLGFGAMRITGDGIWGPPKDRGAAIAVLRRAIELGVNFIDTADSYGPFVSEELIAEALTPYPKDLVIATKGGRQLEQVAPGKDRRLPVARSRPCRSARRVARNLGQHAIRRKSSLGRVVQCHGGTHRARAETCTDRLGAEPVQFCRS